MEQSTNLLAPKKRSIYNISEDLLAINELIMEMDGELTPELEKALAINKQELEDKAVKYAYVILHNKKDLDSLDAEIKRLTAYKKSLEKANDRIKEVLTGALNLFEVDKIKTATISLSFRKSTSVEILDEAEIPNEYKVWEPKVKKTDIKAALEEGKEVPGAQLSSNKSLQIK